MGNPLMRVHKNFVKNITDIEKYREENGFPELKKTKITNLITKHKDFIRIKEDVALFTEGKNEK